MTTYGQRSRTEQAQLARTVRETREAMTEAQRTEGAAKAARIAAKLNGRDSIEGCSELSCPYHGPALRELADQRHNDEHRSCEHLDGAVPQVTCMCGEQWGYHVGHSGVWYECTEGLCRD